MSEVAEAPVSAAKAERTPSWILFGVEEMALRRAPRRDGESEKAWVERSGAERIMWHERDAVNAHIGLFGMSGSGKTHTLRRIVSQVTRTNPSVRVHVMDVHGDLAMPNESTVMFSEATPWGINPLRLSADKDHGGVRKRIQAFIEQLDEVSRSPMGDRQMSALRNLLTDLYRHRGFKLDDPSSWAEEPIAPPADSCEAKTYIELPFEQKDEAKETARRAGIRLEFDNQTKTWWCDQWQGTVLERYPRKQWGKHYPTLKDAAEFAKTRLRSLTTGGGTKSTRLLEEHCKKVVAWQAKARKMEAGMARREDVAELQEEVHAGMQVVIESFTDYVTGIATGRELDGLLRYDTVDTMRAILNRLDGMVSTGIFRSGVPPFDPGKPIHRYNLSALQKQEQKLFVYTTLTRIFDEARERGHTRGAAEINDLVIIDEAMRFFVKDSVLDSISLEARKFGIGLVCASQSPTHFTENFLSNIGTKILLATDKTQHTLIKSKMGVDVDVLRSIQPGKVAAIQVTRRNESESPYKLTRVSFDQP